MASNTQGKQPQGGAPKRNRNAMRHGMCAGKLPKGAEYIENRINTLRRNLEDAVLAAKNAVTIVDASTIDTAIKWERKGLLAQRWLRLNPDSLSPTEWLKFQTAVAEASDKRDKAIRRLQLDKDTSADVFDTLYSRNLAEDQ